MRKRTGISISYLFKMVSRTNIELNIVLIAIVLVFNIDSVYPTNVLNEDLSTTPIPPNLHYTTVSTVNRNSSAQNELIENDTLLFSTDNELWDGLIRDCLRRPSFSCFQKNVHSYLNSALELDDVNVTSSFKFLKNKVDLYKYTKEANDHFMKENEIPDEEARSGIITIFILKEKKILFMCIILTWMIFFSSSFAFFFYFAFMGLMVEHILL